MRLSSYQLAVEPGGDPESVQPKPPEQINILAAIAENEPHRARVALHLVGDLH